MPALFPAAEHLRMASGNRGRGDGENCEIDGFRKRGHGGISRQAGHRFGPAVDRVDRAGRFELLKEFEPRRLPRCLADRKRRSPPPSAGEGRPSHRRTPQTHRDLEVFRPCAPLPSTCASRILACHYVACFEMFQYSAGKRLTNTRREMRKGKRSTITDVADKAKRLGRHRVAFSERHDQRQPRASRPDRARDASAWLRAEHARSRAAPPARCGRGDLRAARRQRVSRGAHREFRRHRRGARLSGHAGSDAARSAGGAPQGARTSPPSRRRLVARSDL